MGDEISPRIYRFGPFEVDLEQRLLLRAGESIPLTPKAFDTLAVLVARPGRLIEKAELLSLVWPNTFVEDNNLSQNISVLRKALGGGEFIQTIPRRGFRFLANVETGSAQGAEPEANADQDPATNARRWPQPFWIGSLLAIAVVAAVACFALWKIRDAARPDHPVDSLVVLPLVNLTGDPEFEYFSDGLTEELTNALAHLEALRVVARTTAFQFKGKSQDIRSIARQLNVNAVLEGSVRREGQRLRVTVQLNDARSGYHIWSKTYEREQLDLFNIQEDVAQQVADAIRSGGQPLKVYRGSRNPEAYHSFLLGRFYLNRPDDASRRRAIPLFQKAISQDSRYAAAYAGLAECYTLLAWQSSIPPLSALAAARQAADQAVALDDSLAEAHTSQAILHLQLARNWAAADQQFRRAIQLNPNDAIAHHWYSHYFIAMGRIGESLAESQRALELDPLDVHISAHLSWHYLRARDYPNAIKAGLQTLELDPHSELASLFLAWSYEDAAQWDKAIDVWQRAGARHPEFSTLAAALQADGPRGYWRARLVSLTKNTSPDNYQLAVLHARLGESDQALESLQRALELHEPELIYVNRESAFDWMHKIPRFKALIGALQVP